MNLVYIDTALCSNLGHHANSCRHIVGEMRSRNIMSTVLAHRGVQQSLRDELGAIPWFSLFTYGVFDADPICGWLTNFEFAAETTAQEMRRLDAVGPNDLVYVNSVQPAQFMAVVRWMKSVPAAQRPFVIVEFGTDPGVQVLETASGMTLNVGDPRYDSRATLHHFTARHLNADDQSWLRLATYDRQSSDIFQRVLGYPVNTLPLPHRATTSRRIRVGRRPITVGILGHQRLDKGYDLVPGLVGRLLAARPDINILVHNGAPLELPEIQQALRDIASQDERLRLNEETADSRLWAELLEQSDLIVCPYVINRFISSYSAVASEAIANAIPLVAPARTTMAGVLREFGDPGTVFAEQTVDSVFGATIAALDDFDSLALLAQSAARRWEQTRGAARLVDTMLSWRPHSAEAIAPAELAPAGLAPAALKLMGR